MSTEFVSPGPDAQSPDHSTCRNCRKAITWADYCYVHDSTGFADCGIVVSGGTGSRIGGASVIVNATISKPAGMTTMAEPVEWGPVT